jgi:hypothetical protein
MMVGFVVPRRSRMVAKVAPSFSSKISLARNTYPAGKDRNWAILVSSLLCCSFSWNIVAVRTTIRVSALLTVTLRQLARHTAPYKLLCLVVNPKTSTATSWVPLPVEILADRSRAMMHGLTEIAQFRIAVRTRKE